MTQDPERDESQDPEEVDEGSGEEVAVDNSHGLDMVSLYDSKTVDAEMESDVIQSLLESNGVPSMMVDTPYPPLGFEVKVPRNRLEEARRIVEEAKAAGPEAAEEAEAESEKQ